MNLQSIITIIRAYPFVDIERAGGILVRKHIDTNEITDELLRSYVEVYSEIVLVPKKKSGSVFVRTEGENITINRNQLPTSAGLNGFEQMPVSGNENNLYKILYEQKADEVRELRTRNDTLLSEIRKLEVEHAGSKNSFVGDMVQGLAGIAPMLMGGGAAPLAGVQQPEQKALPAPTAIQDNRLLGIIRFYQQQDEPTKAKIYELLSKVFAKLDGIDDVIGLID